MHATIRKYAFETVFDVDGEVLRDASGARSIFSLEEVEAERRAAYEAGRTDATVQALTAVSAELASITTVLRMLVSRYGEDIRTLRGGAAELALAAARAVAGEALAAHGDERIRAVVEGVLDETLSAPRIVVKAGADAAERLRPQLEAIADDRGAAAVLVVRSDPALGLGDVSIEWSEGHVALDAAACISDIEARVRSRLSAVDSYEARFAP
jgi:flagellar assembly protein FliH